MNKAILYLFTLLMGLSPLFGTDDVPSRVPDSIRYTEQTRISRDLVFRQSLDLGENGRSSFHVELAGRSYNIHYILVRQIIVNTSMYNQVVSTDDFEDIFNCKNDTIKGMSDWVSVSHTTQMRDTDIFSLKRDSIIVKSDNPVLNDLSAFRLLHELMKDVSEGRFQMVELEEVDDPILPDIPLRERLFQEKKKTVPNETNE